MPKSPPRPCTYPRCNRLVESGRCELHPYAEDQQRKQKRKQSERVRNLHRGTAASRGYGYAWQKARKIYLARYPLCVMCEQDGRVVTATVVDHVLPHRGNEKLFWDISNWQSLCKPCHDRKTYLEDGALGERKQKG